MSEAAATSVRFVPLFWLLGQILFLALLFLIPVRARGGTVLLTLPVLPEFAASDAARKLVGRYRLGDFLVALVAAAVACLGWRAQSNAGLIAAPLVQVAGLVGLWMLTWRALLPHRAPQHVVRTASLTGPLGPSAAWYAGTLAALAPLALVVAFLAAHWHTIPTQFATHWGIDGQPNGWGNRTVSDVFFPCGFAALLVLWITAMGWLVSRFSPGVKHKPEVQKFTTGTLTSAAWLVSLLMSAVTLLAVLPSSPQGHPWYIAGLILPVFAFLAFVGVRARKAFQANPAESSTPAQAWLGGILYYNPADQALMVPKRSGMGYTFNFARPAAWAILAGILLLVLAPTAWTLLAHKH